MHFIVMSAYHCLDCHTPYQYGHADAAHLAMGHTKDDLAYAEDYLNGRLLLSMHVSHRRLPRNHECNSHYRARTAQVKGITQHNISGRVCIGLAIDVAPTLRSLCHQTKDG